MHTGKAGLKHRKLMGKDSLHVDIMHLAILLGKWLCLFSHAQCLFLHIAWTLDILTPVILKNEDFDMDRRIEILRALQKVVWIHNDLFTRHYVQRATHVSALRSASASVGSFSTINEHPPSMRASASSGSSSGGVNESYFPGSAPGDRVSGASPVRRPGTSSSTHSFTSGSSGALGFDKQSQSGKQRKTFFGF